MERVYEGTYAHAAMLAHRRTTADLYNNLSRAQTTFRAKFQRATC